MPLDTFRKSQEGKDESACGNEDVETMSQQIGSVNDVVIITSLEKLSAITMIRTV